MILCKEKSMCIFVCVCVCKREREREIDIQKTRKTVLTRMTNDQQLQRRGEGAYIVIYSLYSLTPSTS